MGYYGFARFRSHGDLRARWLKMVFRGVLVIGGPELLPHQLSGDYESPRPACLGCGAGSATVWPP
jgi:hypothetical protein